MASGTDPNSNNRLIVGAFIVVIALGAIVGALALVLNHYPTPAASSGNMSDTSSTSIVAIIVPVATALTAIAGLYFGVSASGSTKGQAAAAQTETAALGQTAAKAAALLTKEQAQEADIIKR
jgi:hypothetical protein